MGLAGRELSDGRRLEAGEGVTVLGKRSRRGCMFKQGERAVGDGLTSGDVLEQ